MPAREFGSVDTLTNRSLSFTASEPPPIDDAPRSGERAPVAIGPGRSLGAHPAHVPERARDVNEYPIQESKVHRPPLREATLRRDRLLDWLNAKIHHRIVFVTAEAGYGKTTLLSDFARRTRLRTLWYRLDDDDRDWISLLNYLVAAGRQVEPTFAPSTGALLRELGAGGPARETIVDTFIHELGLFAGGAVLILDDYHLIDDVPDVRAVMREVVARAPERLTIVFVSRRRPTIPLARIRALGELVELHAEDLRFDEAETERLFRETYGTPLEPDVLADLTRRTEGWAASLQLVQAAIRDRSLSEIRSFVHSLTGAQAELHDYLAEEVVGELDQGLQSFLMRTSILQAVDPELAGLAAGVDETEADAAIAAAEAIGLLPPRGSARRDGRRYHPLVRDFLEARLRREVGHLGVVDLHRGVARYAEAWSWRLAAHHYAAAGDIVDLHRVTSDAARTILGSGEFALAESYLDRHPLPSADPAFDMIRSRMELHRDQVPIALERARAAFAAFPPDSTDPKADLALANLVGVEFFAGNHDETLLLARRLESRQPEASLAAIASATVELLRASTDGNLDVYSHSLTAMLQTQRQNGDTHYLGITYLNLATVARAQANAGAAVAYADAAIEALLRSSSGHELPAARSARAWGLVHQGRWAEGMAELSVAVGTPYLLARGEVLHEAADVHSWYGEADVAQQFVDEHVRLGLPPSDAWRVSAAQNLVRLRRFEEAQHLLDSTTAWSLSTEVAHGSRRLAVTALLAVTRGDGDARERVAVALRKADAQRATFWSSTLSVLAGLLSEAEALSAAVVAIGQRDPAILSVVADQLTVRLHDLGPDAVRLVTIEAARRPERWRPPLRLVVERHSAAQLSAARILDQIGTRDDVPRLRVLARTKVGRTMDPDLGRRLARNLAPRVFVEDQGRVAIRIGDETVPGTEVRRKVLSLLCFLLTRPDLAATRDQVLDALWPDLEPGVAGNSLNQTVYFLRRVFEPGYRDDVSPEYVHHSSDLLWLDSELVTSRSRLCRDLIRRSGPTPTPAEVETISQTYSDRFALDFTYEEWASAYRDSLHAAYLEVVERAIHQDTNSGHFERGISIARRAIDVDPEAEHVEFALLRLYRLTGAHAAAAEQYGHYSAMVREELGVEPPPLDAV